MMISLVAALIASPAASFPAQPVTRRDAKCPDAPSVYRATGPDKPGPRRLDREPPASTYLTLFRAVDGCATPVVLRDGRER